MSYEIRVSASDWATATRGFTDTVDIPPWMMEKALRQLDEKADEMISNVLKSAEQLNK